MKFSYQLARRDYIEAAAARMKQSPKNPVKGFRVLLLVLVVLVLLPTAVMSLMRGDPLWQVPLWILSNPIFWALALAFLLINEYTAAWSALRRAEAAGEVDSAYWEPRQVTVTAGGLLFTGAEGTKQVRKTDIRRLLQTGRLLVLLLEDRSFCVIPKSAFPSAQQLKEVLAALGR